MTYVWAEDFMAIQTVTASTKNRRRSQRRRPRSTVKVECRKGSSGLGANVARLVLDLSEIGVCMVVSQEFAPAAEVEIIIGGYGIKKPLRRLATVRWQMKLENGNFCTGIEFQKQLPYRDWQNLAAAT